MAECEFCKLVEKGVKLFEDEKVVAVLHNAPAAKGHVLVLPKEHFAIIEQTPDFIASRMFEVANKVSTVMFETLNAQGTNLVIENGTGANQKIPHLAVNVIPRMQGDGLSFQWQPRKLPEEQMSDIEIRLKGETEKIGEFEKEKKAPVELDKETEKVSDEDVLLGSIKRLP